MFTGLVQILGVITEKQLGEQACVFAIRVEPDFLKDVTIGDSICVQGVCLTDIRHSTDTFYVDVSNETLACTTLGGLELGSEVNLEKSLTLQSLLGGHLVSGHVDAMGTVLSIEVDGNSTQFEMEVPTELAKYIAKKGSICIDGTSLTVNSVRDNSFKVNIIPHTMENTMLKTLECGSKVNIEVDLIARYVERLRYDR